MHEIVIVGGGLCGLALADELHRAGREFALYEARPRLGGRIDSVWNGQAGIRVDLGPSWYWPNRQPAISGLVAELGLQSFDQHDTGEILHMKDTEKGPETEAMAVHEGTRRVEGGMASLVDALSARLPEDRIHPDHELTNVKDRGDYVQLLFLHDGQLVKVIAKTVILAVPPRLLEEHVLFEPPLPEDIGQAMREAATWMADIAKVVMGYDRPFWRENGQAGNAFVSHGQATLGEIFDACDAAGAKAALGGFVALAPEDRERFSTGLPMLLANQMAQIFGPEAEQGEQLYRNWAAERFTCAARDRTDPARNDHAGISNPLLRRPLWDAKLLLSGTETAARDCGYLEGALQAAAYAAEQIGAVPAEESTDALSGNAALLAQFEAWVRGQGGPAFDSYRTNLNARLSEQNRDQLTQMAVLETVEATLDSALVLLGELEFDMKGVPVESGRSALIPEIQAPFRDFLQTLMDDVIAFNRTSCALSNFPYEHNLPDEYKQTILRDVAAAWREFSLAANGLLLSSAEAQTLDHAGSQTVGKIS